MKNHILLQSAFVLHSRAYLNSSLIIKMLTRDHGVVGLVAKGVRRPKSKLKGMLQPFCPITINYINKSTLGTLIDAEQSEYSCKMPSEKLVYSMYLNELLIKLLHEHDSHSKLYENYKQTISDLKKDICVESLLRKFEIKLLNELGYGIDFCKEAVTGNAISPEQLYSFNVDVGFEIIKDGYATRSFIGKNILAISNFDFDNSDILLDAKVILRGCIANKLGHHQLKSRSLLVQAIA